MNKIYALLIFLAAGLLIANYFYKSGTVENGIPEKFINKSHIEQVFDEKKIVNNTKGLQPKNQTFFLINNMSGGGGSGGGGGGSGGTAGCSGRSYSESGDYYVKAKVVEVENAPNGNQMVSTTYAIVDEYDKINQSMPDLNLGNLVVISSLEPPGGSQNPGNPFIYVYLEKTSDGFTLLC